MHPQYLTQAGTGSTSWQIANWDITPVNIGIAFIASGTVNYQFQYPMDDPSGTFNPNGTAVTAFNLAGLSGTANATGCILTPIGGWRVVNTGIGSVTAIVLQAGIAGP